MSTKKQTKQLSAEQLEQVSTGYDGGEYASPKNEELDSELVEIVGGHDGGEYSPKTKMER